MKFSLISIIKYFQQKIKDRENDKLLVIFLYVVAFFPIPFWSRWQIQLNSVSLGLYLITFIFLYTTISFRLLANENFNFKGIFAYILIIILLYLICLTSYWEIYFQTSIDADLFIYYIEHFSNLYSDSKEFFHDVYPGIWLHTICLFMSFVLSFLDARVNNVKRYLWLLPFLIAFYLSMQFDSTLNHKKIINNENLSRDKITKVNSIPYHFDKPDVIIFLLEGVSDSFLNFPQEDSKIDKRNIQKVENCFIPIPHSSKSIFTLLTGSIQLNTTRPKLNPKLIQNSLSKFFQTLGYQTNFIFTQSFAFENIDDIANNLFNKTIDSRALEAWSKNKSLTYQTFAWGIDDTILIDYVDEYLLNTQDPIFTLIGFSNTHSPYFIPSTNPDHRKGKLNKLERYKSSIKRTETILVDLMNRFLQRRKKEPLFLILSDHGESFGERNFHNHNYSIYNQETKIPCIFIHSSFKNKLSIKSAGLKDIGTSIKNLISPNVAKSKLNIDIFSDQYLLKMPLKTWNSNNFIGLIEGDTKYILDKRRNQLFLMDLNEDNIKEQTSSKDFDLFYKKWNAYSEE